MKIKTKRSIAIFLTIFMTLSFCSSFITIGASASDLVLENIASDATITLKRDGNGAGVIGTESLLTDGVKLTGGYNTAVGNFATYAKNPGIILSFDSVESFLKFQITALGGTGTQDGSAVRACAVAVYASTADAAPTAAADWGDPIATVDYNGTNGWQTFEATLDEAVSAKHLRFSFDYTEGTWSYTRIQEIETYKAPDVPPVETPEELENVASQAEITLKRDGNGNGVIGDSSLLTDGVKLTGGYNTAVGNFSTYAKNPGIILSFDSVESFWEFNISALGGTGTQDGSANQTSAVHVYASTDETVGDTTVWNEVAVIDYNGTAGWQTFSKTLDEAVSARHLKFTFDYSGDSWSYTRIQEIEACIAKTVGITAEKSEVFANDELEVSIELKHFAENAVLQTVDVEYSGVEIDLDSVTATNGVSVSGEILSTGKVRFTLTNSPLAVPVGTVLSFKVIGALNVNEASIKCGDDELTLDVIQIETFGYQTTDRKIYGKYSIRLVAQIRSLSYESVGFEVFSPSHNKTFPIQPCTCVYESLSSQINGVDASSVPSEDGSYFTAIIIKDLPATEDVTLEIKPYVVKSGTEEKIYGEKKIIALENSQEMYYNNNNGTGFVPDPDNVALENVANLATITLKRDGNGAGVIGDISLLTDGVKLTGGYNTALQNFATYAKSPGVIFSFDSVMSFYEFKVTALGGEGTQDGSAVRTKTVNIYASTADAAPTAVADWGDPIATVDYNGTAGWQTFEAILDEAVNAKHLRFSFDYTEGSWSYTRIQEIEAYAVAEDAYANSDNPDYLTQTNLVSGKTPWIYSLSSIPTTYRTDYYNTPTVGQLFTNGLTATGNDSDPAYVHFTHGSGREIIFDIGYTAAVKKIVLGCRINNVSLISQPETTAIYLSEDGYSWYKVGYLKAPNYASKSYNRLEGTADFGTSGYKARYVRLTVDVGIHCWIDEISVLGTQGGIDGAAVLNNQIDPDPNDDFANAYPSVDSLGGSKNVFLSYNYMRDGSSSNYVSYRAEKSHYLPVVGYYDRNNVLQDVMFDSILFLPYVASNPSFFSSNTDADMQDWIAYQDDVFAADRNIFALNSAVSEVKSALDRPDFKEYVYFSIFHLPAQQGYVFGDVDGDGVNEDPYDDDDYLKIMKWYIDSYITRFASSGLGNNLTLNGFYWYDEHIVPSSSNIARVKAVINYIHQKGYKVIWIPSHKSTSTSRVEELGFDAAFQQPGYMFDSSCNYDRLEINADASKLNGLACEIEISGVLTSERSYGRYLDYLRAGVEKGYMNTVKAYYASGANTNEILQMFQSTDARYRALYDLTYKYTKSTLSLSDFDYDKLTLNIKRFNVTSDTTLSGTLDKQLEYISVVLKEDCTNGTFTVLTDGTFTYTPDSGFVGKDSVIVTFSVGDLKRDVTITFNVNN